jgi:glycosyltransferase involved in cell wall biosynthesis
MKISIIASPFWPIPNERNTGDLFYAQLANTLGKFGHDVSFFAPEGSIATHCKLFTMSCSNGIYNDGKEEQECLDKYTDLLHTQDIVHDFSYSKKIAELLLNEGHRNIISTHLGGRFARPFPSYNVITQSYAQKDRLLRCANDYENVINPDPDTLLIGGPGESIKDAHVVHNGIDTNFFTPTYNKKDYFLWFGRWHPLRGYDFVIELAKQTGIKLVMMGINPDQEIDTYMKSHAQIAFKRASQIPNISFEWLPFGEHHHTSRRKIMREAKALIQPTQFHEPFGLIQPETLACGTPIITTNYGSMPEIVIDGKTGFVTDNNIDSFKNALSKIDSINPRACREDAVKRFDLTTMVYSYIKEYKEIIKGNCWGM